MSGCIVNLHYIPHTIFASTESIFFWMQIFYLKGALYFYLFLLFTLLGQKRVCDTRDEDFMKIHKKIKIGIPEIDTFCYAITSKVYWIWSLNFRVIMEKIKAFSWYDTKWSTTYGWSLGYENFIGIRGFNDWFLKKRIFKEHKPVVFLINICLK